MKVENTAREREAYQALDLDEGARSGKILISTSFLLLSKEFLLLLLLVFGI